jgi:hypothetical protein
MAISLLAADVAPVSAVSASSADIGALAWVGIGVILTLKFLIPVLTVFFPFASGWANFLLDSVDGDLLVPLGLANSTYQPIDKLADWATYIAIVVLVHRSRWPMRKLMTALFVFRSIGQTLFLLTENELVLFFFPNFLEPTFLVIATILFVKRVVARRSDWREAAFATVSRHRWLIGIGVFLYKMQDEYITHVGNIDRTDLVRHLFGG